MQRKLNASEQIDDRQQVSEGGHLDGTVGELNNYSGRIVNCAFRHGVPFRSRKIVSFHSLDVSFYMRLCFCNFCHASLLE